MNHERTNDGREEDETAAAIARGVAKHGPSYAAWVELAGTDRANDEQAYLDAYLGTFDSPAQFAETLWEDLGFGGYLNEAIPDSLRSYVQPDFERWARDMRLSGEVEFIVARSGEVGVFRL